MNSFAKHLVLLVFLGAGWGITIPLSKIAVSTGHRQFGLIFWQLVIGAIFMGVVLMLRRKRLPIGAAQVRVYVIIALVGTVVPNSASFQAIVYLPAGIISILLSLVPMFALPIALGLGVDRFSLPRLFGLLFGAVGVLLIVGPEAALPSRAMLAFIPIALVAPLCYGLEGNIVARWGTAGLDPMQVLAGASLIGAVIALPLALASGQWIDPRFAWGAPEWALVVASLIHVVVYAAYVWLVGRAGSVFAAQVSYLVTGFGVFWAILILGESYSGYVWLSVVVIFLGLLLVQPRPPLPVAAKMMLGQNKPR